MLFTASQLAHAAQPIVTSQAVRRWESLGQLPPAQRLQNGSLVWTVEVLAEWLSEQTTETAQTRAVSALLGVAA